MELTKNKRSGISLIVLVITIIIMIILAAAIILSLNSSGIIGKANQAKLSADKANAIEAASVALAEYQLEANVSENIAQTAEEYVKNKLKGNFEDRITENINILNDGTIQILPIIPTGFVVSPYNGENKVSEGLVIYEASLEDLKDITNEEAKKTYNQYVWVPIEETFERTAWKNEDLSNKYVEPLRAGIPYIEADISKYSSEIDQYNAMKASVKENGGFYIGRYEAGLPEGKTLDTIKKDGTDKPVSKKDAIVWTNLPFDTTYRRDETTYATLASLSYGDDTQNGCAKISKATYSNAERHLIYGVQWDATLRFVEDEEHNITNSSTWGNCYNYNDKVDSSKQVAGAGEEIKTAGFSENWKAKNIYDLAGNVWEKTYESNAGMKGSYRIIRGGAYKSYGSSFPAFAREAVHPGNAIDPYGFRMVIYIK